MTDRLLTNDDVAGIYGCDVLGGLEGFIAAGREVAKAQDAKTLKAVGEWLEQRVTYSTLSKVIIEFVPHQWEAFKKGELPE